MNIYHLRNTQTHKLYKDHIVIVLSADDMYMVLQKKYMTGWKFYQQVFQWEISINFK